jgi:nucleoid-associated protein YgaU
MGLISFLKDAGEKMLHGGAAASASTSTPATPESAAPAPDGADEGLRAKEQALERAILDYMAAQNLPTSGVTVRFESATATVYLSGSVPDQQTREKMILCSGNVQGVEHVDDGLTLSGGDGAESQWYTVQSGDSLSKIAQDVYGDASRYNTIFEANQPMLSDPNRIYPGQKLRIPAQA